MRKQMTNIVLAIIVLTLTVLSIDTYAQVVHFRTRFYGRLSLSRSAPIPTASRSLPCGVLRG